MLNEAWSNNDTGYVLQGDVKDIPAWLVSKSLRPSLIIADPPYGSITKEQWDVADVSAWIKLLVDLEWCDCPIYWWGGIGKPSKRPLLEFALRLEKDTKWKFRDWITWRKKRAYGKRKDYLFVREECLLLTIDGKEPETFHTPLLETKRGYSGYNAKYPAKSEFLRVTNVWDESEIFRGKLHPTQKASKVISRPIQVNTNEGEWVLDLYSGSGETSVQAKLLGRKFIAVEQNETYVKNIIQRLNPLD